MNLAQGPKLIRAFTNGALETWPQKGPKASILPVYFCLATALFALPAARHRGKATIIHIG